ncbi:GGDEF domain-containing protein [Vibrio aestuarianus]|uniref:GGDEF domain-containing protein n=1 Tax=Vibrio aestuarianus TaxID=28171 RepID=UPI00237CDA87|nr:GGDEF domain-containing protein [Vibrio aestuarianus]MDE1350447.1 GGDEF domain-containing protein [Vibrio aestuarianus]
MEFTLDLRTICFITAVFSISYGVGLSLFNRAHQRSYNLMPFVIGLFAIGLGTALISLRGFIFSWLSIVTANILICIGFTYCLYGFSLFRQANNYNVYIAFYSLPIVFVLFTYFTYFQPSVNARTVVVSVYLTITMLMTAYNMHFGKAQDSKLPVEMLVIAYVMVALVMFIRATFSLYSSDMQSFMGAGVIHQLAYMIGVFNLVAIVFGLVWMINERLIVSIEALSMQDDLTQFYNRRGLDNLSNQEMQMVKKNGSTLSVLMCDIDHFKLVNDTHGHQVGDRVLQDVAAIIREQVQADHLTFRYGGEEFLILLPNTSKSEALQLAQSIREAVEIGDLVSLEGCSLTVSIGVSQLRHGDTFATLVKCADAALYTAKSNGRNCVVSYAD